MACALCKDPVVIADPYMLHLQEKEIFDRSQEAGLKLGRTLVACYYCGDAVKKGGGYRFHVANKHEKHLQHLEHLYQQWKEKFDLERMVVTCAL